MGMGVMGTYTIGRIMEVFVCLIPMGSSVFSLNKIKYRYKFAITSKAEGDPLDVNSWGWNGARIQMICMSACIFVYCLRIVSLEKPGS